MDTKNLGQVAAMHIGTVAPVNIKMLWYDTNVGVNIVKYYDTVSLTWKSFISGFTPAAAGSIYFSDGSGITGDISNLRWNNTTKKMSIGGITTPTGRLEIKGLGNTSGTYGLGVFKLNGDINSKFKDDGAVEFYGSGASLKLTIDPNGEVSGSINYRTTGRVFANNYSGQPGRGYTDFAEHDNGLPYVRFWDNLRSVVVMSQAGVMPIAPNGNLMMDLISTNRGFAVPRMTQAQKNAIPVTAADDGMMVYQTDVAPGLYIYKQAITAWVFVI
jgi:hypothetical protein